MCSDFWDDFDSGFDDDPGSDFYHDRADHDCGCEHYECCEDCPHLLDCDGCGNYEKPRAPYSYTPRVGTPHASKQKTAPAEREPNAPEPQTEASEKKERKGNRSAVFGWLALGLFILLLYILFLCV